MLPGILTGVILGIGVLAAGIFMAVAYPERLKDLLNFNKAPETTLAPAQTTTAGEKVEVPHLVGKKYDKALEDAYKGKLVLSAVYDSDDARPKDQIIRQDIQAGAKVDVNTTVTLIVSSGSAREMLPKITGKTIDTVKKELDSLGFRLVVNEIPNDGAHTAGVILEVVHPKEGESHLKGQEVYVNVWGPGGAEITTTTEEDGD